MLTRVKRSRTKCAILLAEQSDIKLQSRIRALNVESPNSQRPVCCLVENLLGQLVFDCYVRTLNCALSGVSYDNGSR